MCLGMDFFGILLFRVLLTYYIHRFMLLLYLVSFQILFLQKFLAPYSFYLSSGARMTQIFIIIIAQEFPKILFISFKILIFLYCSDWNILLIYFQIHRLTSPLYYRVLPVSFLFWLLYFSIDNFHFGSYLYLLHF